MILPLTFLSRAQGSSTQVVWIGRTNNRYPFVKATFPPQRNHAKYAVTT
jgi:hypothetical protein